MNKWSVSFGLALLVLTSSMALKASVGVVPVPPPVPGVAVVPVPPPVPGVVPVPPPVPGIR